MSAPVYEFGEFRLDCGRFELRRGDLSLKLERKPLEALILLASRQGLLVTRAEIAEKLWDRNVFVDTELGINTVVRKIRAVLEDDPDNPRFVQTVTGMGYRFIAPVRILAPVPTPAAPRDPATTADALPEVSLPDAPAISPGPGAVGTRLRMRLIAIAIATIAGLATAAWYALRPRQPLAIAEYVQLTHDGGWKTVEGTNGTSVYFNESFSDLAEVAHISAEGGEPAPVPLPIAGAILSDVASHSSTFLLESVTENQWHLWSFQPPGGPLRLISSSEILNTANGSAWSPDGRLIAVITQEGDLYRMRSDGSEIRELSAGGSGGVGQAVVWSPDGSRIRFIRNRRLWEIAADGTSLHPVLEGGQAPLSQCGGRWTPDGSFFIFVACDDRVAPFLTLGQLWAIDERRRFLGRVTPQPARLTTGPMEWSHPVPSLDGRSLFARGVMLRGELVRYNTKLKEFQAALGGISVESVAWSRDGKSVAYVTFPEGVLWKANEDGSARMQLTSSPLYPVNPAWSPDGAQIVFYDFGRAGQARGYVISANGGTPRPLTDDAESDQQDPTWSPTGEELAFSTGGESHREKNEIRILNLATRQTRTVPGSGGKWSPRWSPDGRFIAGLTPGQALTLFDFQTQRWSLLSKGMCGYPTWSADSRYVYFVKIAGDAGLYRISTSGGPVEPVIDLKRFRSTGVVGLWFGVDRDGAPLLLRDIGSDEIYALRLARK